MTALDLLAPDQVANDNLATLHLSLKRFADVKYRFSRATNPFQRKLYWRLLKQCSRAAKRERGEWG